MRRRKAVDNPANRSRDDAARRSPGRCGRHRTRRNFFDTRLSDALPPTRRRIMIFSKMNSKIPLALSSQTPLPLVWTQRHRTILTYYYLMLWRRLCAISRNTRSRFCPVPSSWKLARAARRKVAALQSTPLMPQFHSPWPLPSLASRNRGGVGLRLEARFSSARP